MMSKKRISRSAVDDNGKDQSTQNDKFEKLRVTLTNMMETPWRFGLASVLSQLLDSGHIVAMNEDDKLPWYVIEGFVTKAQVDHLIATIDSPVDQAFIELAAHGYLWFKPCDCKGNLLWSATKRGRVAHVN